MRSLHSSPRESGNNESCAVGDNVDGSSLSTSRFAELQTWRTLGLVGVIALMFTLFDVLTNGIFFTPRNLSNLSVQTSVTALLTVSITWLMIARQIDLSGGALIALLGVLIAKWQTMPGWPLGATLVLALVLGQLFGFIQGIIVTRLSIPAFIATLAAFSYLRGAAFIVSDGTTITGLGDEFSTIANANIPRPISAAVFLFAGIVMAVRKATSWMKSKNRESRTRLVDFVATVVFVCCTFVGAWAFGAYRGVPSPVVVLLVVVGAATFVANNTAFGRHIYAIGANPEAARRAGIDVKGTWTRLFVLSGLMATLGALIQTSRLDAGSPGTAEFLALDAVSASVIGGTSLFGGRGTVVGSALGALLTSTIANGLSVLGVNTYWQLVTTGVLLIGSLTIDQITSEREQA